VVHNYETAVHETFLRSLQFCSAATQDYEGPLFTQCIKAAGINFATAYEQFFDFKVRHSQAASQGLS
jgi:hypothetical protein